MAPAVRIPNSPMADICGTAGWHGAVLSKFVGQGRAYSVEQIADIVGFPAASIKQYLKGANGGASPPLDRFLALANVLGPAYVNGVFHAIGLDGLHKVAGATVSSFEIHEKVCGLCHLQAEHMADGKVDHRELAQQRDEAAKLAPVLGAFAHGKGRAA